MYENDVDIVDIYKRNNVRKINIYNMNKFDEAEMFLGFCNYTLFLECKNVINVFFSSQMSNILCLNITTF